MRSVSYTDHKKVAAALKPVNTTRRSTLRETVLLEFAGKRVGREASSLRGDLGERVGPVHSVPRIPS